MHRKAFFKILLLCSHLTWSILGCPKSNACVRVSLPHRYYRPSLDSPCQTTHFSKAEFCQIQLVPVVNILKWCKSESSRKTFHKSSTFTSLLAEIILTMNLPWSMHQMMNCCILSWTSLCLQIYMNAAWHGWAIPMLLFLAILRLSLNYLIAR